MCVVDAESAELDERVGRGRVRLVRNDWRMADLHAPMPATGDALRQGRTLVGVDVAEAHSALALGAHEPANATWATSKRV